MIKLIVFDCDGVMFDSRKANQEYYNQLLSHFGYPPMDEDELEYVHMHNAPDSVRHIFRNHTKESFTAIEEYRHQLGYEPFLRYMHMEDDLIDFLEVVKNDYHLAISTNRSNTMVPLLQQFKLDGYYSKVVTSESAKRPKPAPDGLLEIMTHFDCSASETIFIGDSIIDRQHSSACGVALIAFKNKNLPAEHHVSSFMEILTLPQFERTAARNID